MLKPIRILSFYTIAIILFTIIIPSLTTVVTEKVPLSVIMQVLSFIPVIVLVVMVLLGTRWRLKRTIIVIFAGYTAAVFLYYISLWFTPPLDPSEVILASLYIPIVVFAGVVIVVQIRNDI